MARVIVVRTPAEIPLAIQQVVQETVRDITQIEYQSIFKKQIPFLEKLHSQYFQSSTGPDNRPWAALHPETIKRKGHGSILIDKRRLVSSLTQSTGADAVRDITDRELVFGTRVPYSIYHQQDCGGSSPATVGRGTRRMPRGRRRAGQSLVNRVIGAIRVGAVLVSRLIRRTKGPAVKKPSISRSRSSGTRARKGRMPPRPHVGFNSEALVKFVNNVADEMMKQLNQKWR